MHRVAICDDEIKTCSELESMVLQYGNDHGIQFEVDVWYSGEKLCSSFEQGNEWDLLFLDIELITTDGIAVGRYIRNELKNRECVIVYISSKSSYALSLFKVSPLDFLVKPLKMKEVEDALERYIEEYEQKNQLFEYFVKGVSYKIPYKDIVYFYSDDKKINIVAKDKERLYNGKMREIIKMVPHNFLQIHQSFVVNLDYVEICQYEKVVLQGGTVLNISQPYRKTVREQIMQYKWKRERRR